MAVLAFAVSDSFLLAGTNGNGVWRYPLSLLSTEIKRGLLRTQMDCELDQNYPNPFNPSITIRYELPKDSMVRVSVYDILGREVAVLVSERKDAGSFEVKFDASGMTSGMYFYRLQAGDYFATKKMLVVK